MMLNLLFKDIRLLFGGKKNRKERAFSFALFAFALIALIVLETLLYVNILKRISSFSGAAIAFTTLFLFVISLIMILISLFSERKLFYEEEDKEKMAIYPLPSESVIVSKLLILFFTNYFLTLALTYPLFVAYGMSIDALPSFYFLALFYPFLTFFFECGVSMILLAPFSSLLSFLSKHKLIEYVLASILLAGGCYLYRQILTLFLDLISENGLSRLFSSSSIEALTNARKYFIIVNYLTDVYFLGSAFSLLFALSFSLPTFILGLALTIAFYRKNLDKANERNEKRKKEHTYRRKSVTAALIKKECIIFFRNGDNLFSFSSLLLVAPYLLYLVVLALNTIFTSGMVGYYVGFIKDFVPAVDIAVVSLFALTLGSGADDYITREGTSIKLMKSSPINPGLIIRVKIMIPLLLSSCSLLLGLTLMVLLRTITLTVYLLSLLSSFSALLSYSLISFASELKGKKKGGKALVYLYEATPIIVLGYMLLTSAYGFSSLFIYLTSFSFMVLLLAIILILFLKKQEDMFLSLEVSA